MRIYKYCLDITDTQTVDLPVGSDLLSVGNQLGELCLWAIVDEKQKYHSARTIEIIGTGNPIDPKGRVFLGTVIDSFSVWHVFERLDG
jgi:hypothetical protein